MIKWNTLIMTFIKTQTREHLLKQISINIIRNIFCSCSQWTTSLQCSGYLRSLRDWCCCSLRRVLLLFLFVEQNGVYCWTSVLQVVKRCWWKGSINARSKNSVYIQLISFSVKFIIVQVSIAFLSKPSCARTLESTSSLISSVPCWLGVCRFSRRGN